MTLRLLAVPFLALTLGACVIESTEYVVERDEPGGPEAAPLPPAAATSPIDTGEGLVADAGVGAGVYVEYAGGGRWKVFTTCDTAVSGQECKWDIVALPGGVDAFEFFPLELEGDDDLVAYQADAVQLVAYNDFGVDGFEVEAEPGTSLRIDVWLDDEERPDLIFWIGDGGIKNGPDQPVELTPSEP